MRIADLTNEGAATMLMVTPLQLKEFAMSVVAEVRQQQLEEEPRYTPAEFARRKGVDRSTLYRWVKAGILTPHRVGGKVYYRDSDLLED